MDLSYPDVIGEYLLAPQRYYSHGVQFAGQFEPTVLEPGQVGHLIIFLQNTLNGTLSVQGQLSPPKAGGLFRGGGLVAEIGDEVLEFQLEPVEAGVLTIPVRATEAGQGKTHQFGLSFTAQAEGHAERIRNPSSQTMLPADLIDNPIGLNLVGTLGSTYEEQAVKQASFAFEVGTEDVEDDTPLGHNYQTLFTLADATTFSRAMQEINLRRAQLNNDITNEALYATFFSELTVRFADAGVPLRLGEAITLAKMLTYTCHYFWNDSKLYSGLLVPMWQKAFDADFPTADALDVVRRVGLGHVLRLAITLAFGLMAQQAGQPLWSLEERQGVAEFITENVLVGEPIEPDFIYLPLVLGGLSIFSEMAQEGENVRHSAALLHTAFTKRGTIFADGDMAQAKQLFDSAIRALMR